MLYEVTMIIIKLEVKVKNFPRSLLQNRSDLFLGITREE